MKRPSRRFVWTVSVLLLVAAGLLGAWYRMQPAPPPAAGPPDLWENAAVPGDLRTSPDGPPLAGWRHWGTGSHSFDGKVQTPFVVLVRSDRPSPSTMRQLVDKLMGDPQRSLREGNHHVWRTKTSVTTPTGQWWRYSGNWAKGLRPPPPPAK